jgi:hypothetical protein
MDEIKMFTALRPAAPGDAEEIRQRARARLEAALTAMPPGSPGQAIAARKSRRPLVLAGAVAVAAGAAVVGPAVLPASNSGSFITAAWAVQQNSDGTIKVTINRILTHQAALQADLRADGVPAYVRSVASCAWEPQGGLKQIRQDRHALASGKMHQDSRKIIIHPAAIPAGDAVFIGGSRFNSGWGLQLFLMPNDGPPVCVPNSHPPVGVPVPSPSPPPSPSPVASVSPSSSVSSPPSPSPSNSSSPPTR